MKTNVISIMICIFFFIAPLYAQELGDVNYDTSIDIVDALLVAQYYVHLGPDPFYHDVADVNGSGDINIVDALLIAQLYVGLIDEFPAQSGVQILGSDLKRNVFPDATSDEINSVVSGNNQFAFDLFQEIKADNENIFFSPISITLASAMCYTGAEGNTETEMASTFHFILPEDRLHNAFNSLEITLTKENPPSDAYGEDPQFHIANSTWGQKDYYFMPDFLDTLAINYGAAMNIVDFISNPEACRLLINDWVSDNTESRIEDLLPGGSITDLTRLVLTNAIYFKANWLEPFDEKDTTTGSFYLYDGSTTSASLMYQSIRSNYCEVPGEYQAVELRYQGINRHSMILILPAEGHFEDFENGFTNNKYNEITQGIRDHIIYLTMPKFSYEWDSPLKESLQNLGMKDAFDMSAADLSGMNGETDLFVDNVVHKSFIAVDEKGTEASAATAYIVGTTSMPDEVYMTINRPFFFIIRHISTNTILFFGKVLSL